MSLLDFSYELKLKFSAPVTNHCFILRCLPLSDGSQLSDGVEVSVAPYSSLWRTRSTVERGALMGDVKFAHDEFTVRSCGRAFEREGGDTLPPHPMYLHFTRSTQPDDFLKERAAAFRSEKKDYALAVKVMDLVNSMLKYTPESTGADTSAAEAASLGKGVCQDYSHIFCAIMRLLGVPTRYVAGLNYGCGATHAWNECWLNGCWRAFDCTNDKPAADGYVKLACGVDAEQCALNRGVFVPIESGDVVQTQSVTAVVEYA